MKKKLLLGIVCFVFIGLNSSYSQEIKLSEKPEYHGAKPVAINVLPKYVPLYVISVKELPSYFISREIPQSFPKYDGDLTKEQNEIDALRWAQMPANRSLLTEDAKSFVDQKTKEFKEKYK